MIKTNTKYVNDIIVNNTHINRVYNDGNVYHGGQPTPPQPPISTTPFVIGNTMRYFTIQNFSFGVNDTNGTTTKIAFMMNMSSQQWNSKIFCGPEPWSDNYSIGFWLENDSFAIKRTGLYWFWTTGTFSDYIGSTYWFVYDIKGALDIYSASPSDTHYMNNTRLFHDDNFSHFILNSTKNVNFFGESGSSEPLLNSTIYRIIITEQNGTDQHIVPIEVGGVSYFKNLYTDDTYEVHS